MQQLLKHKKTGKKLEEALLEEITDDTFLSPPSPNKRTCEMIYQIYNLHRKDTAYKDLTGIFPYRSTRGNQYLFIGYHFDTNTILATPIKNKRAETITVAWKDQNEKFKRAGIEPRTYIMDNEASKNLKDALHAAEIDYQLVPPHNHRTNLSEREIQTFKANFKSGPASVYLDFLLRKWD